ncbi:MAG: FkbM family methyltransferase [Pseudomonadota bacterium]
MAVPVLCINRTVDRDRWAHFLQAAETLGITPIRIPAVDAHSAAFAAPLYADLIAEHFWGEPDIKPGALGCFLSHRRAWQHVLENDLDHALICEDDVRLTAIAETVLSDVIDNTADMVFANDRMAPFAKNAPLAPLVDVIDNIGSAEPGVFRAPGADCYILNRHGAEMLLTRTAEHRIICGVDWALVSAGLPRAALPEPEGDLTASPAREFHFLRNALPPADPPLRAFVAAKPLATLDREAPSVLSHRITRSIKDFVKIDSKLTHSEYVSTLLLGGAALNFAGRSGNDPVMAAHRFGRVWEADALSALLARFPEGGTFVDVGAHLGNHSVVVARLGAAARVIAVEPNLEITRLLWTNLALNHVLERVEIRGPGLALGKAEGAGWLLRNRRKSSETMVKSDLPEAARAKAEKVRLTTGDALVGEEPVDALKIDTSGTEIEVLRGFSSVVERQRPMLLIDHAVGQQERVMRVLEGAEYRLEATYPSERKNRASSLILPARRRDGGR